MSAPRKIGVIAGAGALPMELAQALAAQGRDYHIIALRGITGDWARHHPHDLLALGQVGGLFKTLARAGCDGVILAGAINRPALTDIRFDLVGVSLTPRLARLMRSGDDALLRGLADMFSERGVSVLGAQDFMAHALAPEGRIAGPEPGAQDIADIARAAQINAALGPLDVGQAVAVAQGVCLGVEALEGTKALLERVAALPKSRRAALSIPSGALYKAPKSGQDRRFDLPAIGPDTIRQARAAGLNGVALEAGAVFILEREACMIEARRLKIFLYGHAPQGAAP